MHSIHQKEHQDFSFGPDERLDGQCTRCIENRGWYRHGAEQASHDGRSVWWRKSSNFALRQQQGSWKSSSVSFSAKSHVDGASDERGERGYACGKHVSVLWLKPSVDILNNDKVSVDFRPLYQCLHIHDVLGMRNFFRMHYEENRRVCWRFANGWSVSSRRSSKPISFSPHRSLYRKRMSVGLKLICKISWVSTSSSFISSIPRRDCEVDRMWMHFGKWPLRNCRRWSLRLYKTAPTLITSLKLRS